MSEPIIQDQETENSRSETMSGVCGEDIKERSLLAAARMEELLEELENGDHGLPEAYACFFYRTAEELCKLNTICEAGDVLAERSLEELQLMNRDLYEDVLPERYGESFANPAYAVSVMGEDMGRCMSFLQAEIHSVIPDAFFGDAWELLIREELLLEVYGTFMTALSETGRFRRRRRSETFCIGLPVIIQMLKMKKESVSRWTRTVRRVAGSGRSS